MNTLYAAACALAVLLPMSASAAQPISLDRSAVTVALEDLDLTRAQDLRTAEQRIRNAAHRICSGNGRTTLRLEGPEAACQLEAERLGRVQLKRVAAQATRDAVQLHASR